MLKDLLSSGNYEHIYIVARWFYKHGQEIIKDELYDLIEGIVKDTNPKSEYLKHHWLEDVEPEVLMDLYDLSLVDLSNDTSNSLVEKYQQELIESGSISITPLRDYMEIYNWLEQNQGVELCRSLKVDGVNTKELIDSNSKLLKVASSRGRHGGDLKDFTDAALKKFQGRFRLDTEGFTGKYFPVYAEAYVDWEGVKFMKEFTGNSKKFVNRRSTALSVLTTNSPDKVYDHLHFMIFKVKNVRDSLYDTLLELEALGYEVPPYDKIVYTHMEYSDFVKWLDNDLYRFKELGDRLGIPSDGLVIEIDNQVEFGLKSSTENYSSGNIAVKVGPWRARSYIAKVENFLIGSDLGPKELKSVRLAITPTLVDSGDTVTKVNAYNLGYVQRLGILPGSEIYFVHQSQTTGVLEGVVKSDNQNSKE